MSEMVPKVRFQGFTDDWEEREFGKVVTRVSRTSKDDDLPRVEYEDIVSGQGVLNKNIFEKDSRKQGIEFKDGDTLFGKLRPYLQNWLLADFDGIAVGDWWVLRSNVMDNKFVYSLIQTSKYQTVSNLSTGTKMPRSDWKVVSKTEFNIPVDKNEQEKIGMFFTNIDKLITLHQRKLELLKEQKTGYLQKMFPKNGQLVPEVRFEEFTDDWEQRKLGELYIKNLERNEDKFKADKTISIATMKYKSEGNGASENSLPSYKVLREGDIAFEGHTSKEFSYGRFVLNDIGNGIMSPRFTTLRPIQKLPIKFWKQYINYEPVMRYPIVNSTKLGTMMNELVVDEFFRQSIPVPNVAEQEKIGTFFKQLDDLITLHQRKFDRLKEQKKGFMQSLFV